MIRTTRRILQEETQLGPYPLEKLPRIDKITSTVLDESIRPIQNEHILNRFLRGMEGEKLQTAMRTLTSGNTASAPLLDVLGAIKNTPCYPIKEKARLDLTPHELSRHIKKYSYFLGAEQVGICRIPQAVLYQDDQDGNPYECGFEHAIVFLIRKDPQTCAASYGDEWIDDAASFVLYERLGAIAQALANYIRRLGYEARPSHTKNYVTLMPRLIAEAGLGEFSRMGIVVNPFVGASFKAACVLCSLPLEDDKPIDFGLQHYCEHCMICADHCPIRAVPKGGKTEHNGYVSWILDAKRCGAHCVMNPKGDICQRCTKVCPFNRPAGTPEQFKDWDGNLDYLYQLVEEQRRFNEAHDYIMPDERQNKWWLPIREQDGAITEMPEHEYT